MRPNGLICTCANFVIIQYFKDNAHKEEYLIYKLLCVLILTDTQKFNSNNYIFKILILKIGKEFECISPNIQMTKTQRDVQHH